METVKYTVKVDVEDNEFFLYENDSTSGYIYSLDSLVDFILDNTLLNLKEASDIKTGLVEGNFESYSVIITREEI